jgi:serine protease AprX
LSHSIRWTRWALMTWIIFALLAAVTVAMASASGTSAWVQKVDASVLDAAEGGQAEFVVYLDRQADLSGAASLTSKEAKGRFVYEQLTAVADQTQPAVVAALGEQGARAQRFWVSNAIVASGNLDALQAVAGRADVDHIYAVGKGRLEPPVSVDSAGGIEGTDAVATVFDSIALVKADQAWGLGYRGQGAVVAGADTGVRWTHEALQAKYRGWNGTVANHNYNWHDAIHFTTNPPNVCGASSPTPCDDDTLLGGGHGTHTVGTMVGTGPERAGEKNEIGMAPDAKWIACRNMAHGLGVVPTYLECMQWFIAPTDGSGQNPDPSKAPHVVNNSWGCVEGCPPPLLRDALQASRAAGIFYAVSAGNDGGEAGIYVCSSIYHPLARYPEAFSVGATTWTTDSIAEFSSRGPTILGDPPNELILRKPNITAPGVSIRSAQRANDSRYGSLSGTSMAGPHVAGLVALIISANPALAGNVDLIEDIIEQTAVRKTTTEMCGLDSETQIPNNTYGWGRIDALAAVQRAVAERPDLQVTNIDVVNNRPPAGEKNRATITATVANTGAMAAGASKTEFLIDGARVLALVDSGTLAPGATQNVSVGWDTRRETNGPHQITVTADQNGQVAESSETNNSSTVTRTVQGNHVTNGSFENGSGGSPDGWSGSSTGAGSSSWSEGGSDGTKSASASGNGGNAAVLGSPTWTSSPIPVTPGTLMDLEVSALATGASSPPSAGLDYLGPLGNVIGSATLVTVPLGTEAFTAFGQSVTIPAGVAQLRVVLSGFSPTDLATGGTVKFDDVGLYLR